MADIKISQLPTTGTAAAGDEIETNTLGSTPSVKRTIAQIMAAGLAAYSPAISAGVGADAHGATFSPQITEAASGTHAVLAGLRVAPTIVAGAANVTTAAGIFADTFAAQTGTTSAYGVYANLPTGATNNYALFATGDSRVSKSASGSSLLFDVFNSSDTANSNAQVTMGVAGTSGGDPRIQWYISGASTWTAGIDNSDSDKWKLSASSALGTNDLLRVSSSGLFDFIGTIQVYSTVTAGVGASVYVVDIQPTLVEAASGTHAELAGLLVSAAFTGAGASTTIAAGIYAQLGSVDAGVTNAAALYIPNAPTGATNNYALFVDAGNVRIDGDLIIGGASMPQNNQNGNYTLVAADANKSIYHNSTAHTHTIPANASVAFTIGTAVTFINANGAGDLTIAITTDTMYLAGDGSTGSRTLAANGVATAVKIASTTWIISGTGLT